METCDAVLELIRSGNYPTPALVKEVGVSSPTISRSVEALRERGHNIKAVNRPNGWRYTIISAEQSVDAPNDRPKKP